MKAKIQYLQEITVQYTRQGLYEKPINTSIYAQEIAREIFKICACQIDLKEYFFIILLNRNNQVIGYNKLSEGGICGTVVDIRIAYAIALKSLASAMVLVHNHPSGNLKPSQQDINITKQFKDAGRLLDIEILDHIILTDSGYYSFTDN